MDADILLYKIGFASQSSVYHVWFEGHEGDPLIFTDKRELNKFCKGLDYEYHKFIIPEPFISCKLTVDKAIESFKEKFKTKDIRLFLTGKGNFREEIATILPYKGNRDSSSKPVHYEAIKTYLINRYKAEVQEGQEADDALGIEQYSYQSKGKLSVIVTIDKDLDMITGWHYNPDKDKLYEINYLEGMRWFYKQCLMGDSVDNIPGIKGIGKVKAGKLIDPLDDVVDMYRTVLDKYEDVYLCPEDALQQVGQLLWMRTKPDEMWEPYANKD